MPRKFLVYCAKLQLIKAKLIALVLIKEDVLILSLFVFIVQKDLKAILFNY